jgi:hypothetical protein
VIEMVDAIGIKDAGAPSPHALQPFEQKLGKV